MEKRTTFAFLLLLLLMLILNGEEFDYEQE